MKRDDLINALATSIDYSVSQELVDQFLDLRHDAATGTLSRASGGKFVENMVRALQCLETGKYDKKPEVDKYLTGLESRSAPIDDGLRICANRVGRAMYSLRSKRNIVHSGGTVDPNRYDVRFLLHGSQWIMAELLRTVSGLSMAETGRLVEMVQAPVGGLVDDFQGTRVVVVDGVSTREEILILMHSQHPDLVSRASLVASMSRRSAKVIDNNLSALWKEKLLHRETGRGYKLSTPTGVAAATAVVTTWAK